ncbi:MAG TPA: hypothetical protein VFV70_05180, partial [Hyphomonadaceae bacterium]|nr:hypothetical protein [Hyphomonadaceae bacterium]
GFPVMMVRAVPMQPDARLPTFEQSVKQGIRKDWENSKTSQGDNDPGRNQMRLTTIQAANAYALSPCDRAIKAAFVVAASTYMRATVKSERDAKNFSTSMDQRVREAIDAAFDAGGVTTKDFPKGTPLWARAFMNEQMDNSPCGADKQAERRTR